MKRLSLLILIALNVVALGIGPALAGDVQNIIDFTQNTPAKAADVNSNFDEVETAVNDNDSRITTNASGVSTNATAIQGKQNRVSDSCAAGESIRAIAADGSVTCEVDDVGVATGMPGVDWADSNTTQYLTTTDKVMLSRTLTAPTAGYVVANFGGISVFNHTSGDLQYMRVWINTDGGASDAGRSFRYLQVPSGAATGLYYRDISTMIVIPVNAGSTTFYAVGDSDEPSGSTRTNIYMLSLNLMFFPNRY